MEKKNLMKSADLKPAGFSAGIFASLNRLKFTEPIRNMVDYREWDGRILSDFQKTFNKVPFKEAGKKRKKFWDEEWNAAMDQKLAEK